MQDLVDIEKQERERKITNENLALLAQVKMFFSETKLPPAPVQLFPWLRIVDVELFVKSHLQAAQHWVNKGTFMPDLERLKEFKEYLEKNL